MKISFVALLIVSLIIISGCDIFGGRYVNQSEDNKTESNNYHLECYNNYCLKVGGEGEDQCSTDLDCKIETHSECVNKECIEVEGPGKDECTVDSNCRSSGGGSGGDDGGDDNPEEPTPILTEFGLNVPESNTFEMNFSANQMLELDVKRVRIWEDWGNREPTQDTYNWEGLDLRINNMSQKANADYLLTIKPFGITNGEVNWYCDDTNFPLISENSCIFTPEGETAFQDYIAEIVQRYDNIDKISFSNEWDSTSHFMGTAEDYVKYNNWLYDITKQYSPETTVVLGPTTRHPFRYIAICELNLTHEYFLQDGTELTPEQIQEEYCNFTTLIEKEERVRYVFENAKYDMVDIHFYDDPEYWAEDIVALKTLTDKPIIVSEFGGPNNFDLRYDATNETFQAEELTRYMNKLIELEIPEAYYFKLVESSSSAPHHQYTGIMKVTQTTPEIVVEPKENYYIFKEYTTEAQLSPLFSPDKETVGQSAIVSLIIGGIGILIIIIYLLSIIYNNKFTE